MRLVCNVTTPQELREEIVSLLLHRATQQGQLAHTTNSQKKRDQFDYAATVLGNLAGEVKCMELVNAWPSGLREEELTYEQIKAQQDAERLMHQWWTLISERERQDTVKGIKGCLEYGCAVTVQRMPEAGKQAVQDAYARHLKHVAELEAKYPSE